MIIELRLKDNSKLLIKYETLYKLAKDMSENQMVVVRVADTGDGIMINRDTVENAIIVEGNKREPYLEDY